MPDAESARRSQTPHPVQHGRLALLPQGAGDAERAQRAASRSQRAEGEPEASGAREARRQGPGAVSRRSQHGPRDVRVGRHRRLSGSGVRRPQRGRPRPAPRGAVMLQRLPFDGAVDADGHILEPPDLWDRYLETAYRDRPMGIRKDADGLEYLEIAGRPSKMVRRGLPAGLGAMDLVGNIPRPDRPRTGPRYPANPGLGAWGAQERLERPDPEHPD